MADDIIPSGRGLEQPIQAQTKNNFWNERSIRNMKGIHPDLLKVCMLVPKYAKCGIIITDGLRTIAEQKEYVRKGVSRTMKSRHLHGFAVDTVAVTPDGKVSYDMKYMKLIAEAFKAAAAELNIPIRWGGDWTGFVDTPHFELWSGKYPDP